MLTSTPPPLSTLHNECLDGCAAINTRLTRLGVTLTTADLPPGETAFYDAATATLRISRHATVADATWVAVDMWLSIVTGAPTAAAETDTPRLRLVT